MAGHDLVFPDIEVGDSGKNHMANIKGLAGAGEYGEIEDYIRGFKWRLSCVVDGDDNLPFNK